MSFILDALKKSEIDRQQRGSAEFAGVPTSSDRATVPRWLWAVGLLLAINLVVLLGLLLRSSAAPTASTATPVNSIQQAMPDESVLSSAAKERQGSDNPAPAEVSFAERVAAAREQNSAPAASSRAVPETTPPQPAASSEPGVASVSDSVLALPTIYEVIADGTVVLPELHLDIHVYSDVPKDRFVFINMSKQREKSQLAEGPIVEEITPGGVVLEYRGTSFLLPRD